MLDAEAYEIIGKARLVDEYLRLFSEKTYIVSNNKTHDRFLSPECIEHKKKGGVRVGFAFGAVFKDRRDKKCYVAVCHDGTFWPLVANKEEGKGAQARNDWAAKHHQEEFNRFTNAVDSVGTSVPQAR